MPHPGITQALESLESVKGNMRFVIKQANKPVMFSPGTGYANPHPYIASIAGSIGMIASILESLIEAQYETKN